MKLIHVFLPIFLLAHLAHAATSYQTPNMGLTIPVPGQETGPQWANDINASLTLIDAHDHTPGNGVPITPAALNINANVQFNGNFITNLGGGFFAVQSGDPSTNASIYSKGVDLYYKDGNGNVIQITSGGGVNGSPGSISNLTSPASASYVSSGGTFVWQQGVSMAANMDMGTAILRYPGSYPAPSGNYIALQAPTSLATGYALTLPATLPSNAQSAMVFSTGGAASYLDPNQLVAATTRTTGSTVGIGGVAISSSSGNFSTTSATLTAVTNLSVTITTSGRPVSILLISDGSGAPAYLGARNTNSGNPAIAGYELQRGSTDIADYSEIWNYSNPIQPFLKIPPSGIAYIDAVSAGTYTYTLYAQQLGSTGGTAYVAFCVLVAYEL